MQGFKSPGPAQRVLAAYGPIAQHCRPRPYLLPAVVYRQEMQPRFQYLARSDERTDRSLEVTIAAVMH
jgi:hypothetical protein